MQRSTGTDSAVSDELFGGSYSTAPSPSASPTSPPPQQLQAVGTPQLLAWPEDTASSFATSSFFSLTSQPASAPQLTSRPDRPVSRPHLIRSTTDSSSSFASNESTHSSASSSATSPSTDPTVALSAPALHLQPESPRYVDTYLSLASTDVYGFLDDAAFRSLYLEHVVHSAQPQWRGESRARLLCVSAALAVGARMYGNSAYSVQCAAVARYCARSIRNDRPVSIEDVALAYRGLLVLSYYYAALLDASEAEWLAIAESLLSVDTARSLIPASLIHVLHLMPPTFADALSLPADEVCEQVSSRQLLLYSADLVRYVRCRRTLRQLISVPDEDDELRVAEGEPMEEGQADITASLTSCTTQTLATLHRSVSVALSSVLRHPSLRFSVYDCLTTVLCCEAAALPTHHRSGVYGIKLACYLLLGRRREAVHAARDIVLFHTGPGRLPTESGPDDGLMLPFAMPFVRSVVVLAEWDDSHDVPAIITSALRLLHGVSLLWPAARSVEAELLERIHDLCRAEMNRAGSQSEMEHSSATEQSQSSRSVQSRTSRLQTAVRMELALEALEIEWERSTPLLGKESRDEGH